jgi:hypothetical protein
MEEPELVGLVLGFALLDERAHRMVTSNKNGEGLRMDMRVDYHPVHSMVLGKLLVNCNSSVLIGSFTQQVM